MSKSAKRRREQHYHEVMRYVRLLEEVIDSIMPKWRALSPPVTRFYLVGPLDGNPNDNTVWLVVPDGRALRKAKSLGCVDGFRDEARAVLQQRGYPLSGID